MRAITFSPAPNWSVKRRLEYIGWAREVVKGLRGASPWLEQQFDNAAAEAEGSIAVRSAKLPELKTKRSKLADHGRIAGSCS